MPTYEYACTECGERLEAAQSFSDDPLTVCPVCQGKLRKLFSPVGVVFKGSGFYKNDSRSKKPAETSTGASNGAKKSGDSEGGSSTSTPDSEGSSTSSSEPSAGSGTPTKTSSGAGSSSSSSSSGGSDSTGGGSKVA